MNANIVNMLLGVIITFLLPKFLCVDEYATLKTYQLYISYCGLFHLGYVDAIYLEYGGKRLLNINQRELKEQLISMKFFQIGVVLLILIAALVSHNTLLIFFAITILPMNMISYFQFMFQALGEFAKYSNSVKMLALLNFISNVLLLVLDVENAYFYITAQVAVIFMVMIFLEVRLYGLFKERIRIAKISFRKIKDKILIGFPLLLGNLMSEILTSIDRWFVKFMLDVVAFAQYSFAANIESFINALVTPITITLYNYFCNNCEQEKIIRIRKLLWVVASYLISGAFCVKFIIQVFLEEYYDAGIIVFLLCAAQFIHVITKGIYVNLYKVKKQQKEYFKKLLIIVGESALLSGVFIFISRDMKLLAIAKVIAAFSWLLLSNNDFKDIRLTFKEFVYMGVVMCIYLVFGMFDNAVLGGITYLAVVSVINYFVFGNELKEEVKVVLRR